MKRLVEIYKKPETHWVGDGFPVRSLFSYHKQGERISPFLLLDHAGPAEFAPSDRPRGVDEHPHKGFETVTIVYQGELEHRDSAGNRGRIGPGDVQWMTAGSGIVHEEKHSQEFTQAGGTFEVAQLWVNLPAEHKISPPGYQTLLARDIPAVQLPGGGTARIIAGELNGVRGPARTFTPVNVWDVRLDSGNEIRLPIPDGFNATVVMLGGETRIGDEEVLAGELALFDQEGDHITVDATEPATLLILSGQPIDEPIAGYGPFVMNTQEEIWQAVQEYQHGRMGRIAA